MRLVSFTYNNNPGEAGVLIASKIYRLNDIDPWLSHAMSGFLKNWEVEFPLLKKRIKKMSPALQAKGLGLDQVQLLAPVPNPVSFRDGYSFRQHVETARRNRGVPMIPAFDEYPVFYFSNHNAITGPGRVYCMADHFDNLDFELECAVVICKEGRNIKAEAADGYIGGLMILNDFSARTLQSQEMLLNLGPAKGKDFATAMGPYLLTPDELTAFECRCKPGHTGKAWDLSMKAFINGAQVSEGSLSDMDWTFAELIERASYGVTLYPGDIIGSGTVGTGCLLELNGTTKIEDPSYTPVWLQPGDKVILEIEQLGQLSNTVQQETSDHSILKTKLCTTIQAS